MFLGSSLGPEAHECSHPAPVCCALLAWARTPGSYIGSWELFSIPWTTSHPTLTPSSLGINRHIYPCRFPERWSMTS